MRFMGLGFEKRAQSPVLSGEKKKLNYMSWVMETRFYIGDEILFSIDGYIE